MYGFALGLTDYNDDMTRGNVSEVDSLPYTTLSYATGPGYTVHNIAQPSRKNLTNTDTRK